jgi:hypothetical protein
VSALLRWRHLARGATHRRPHDLAANLPLTFSRHRLAHGAGRSDTRAIKDRTTDMRKYSSEHFVKVEDVKDGPIEDQIAVVKDGKYDKPNVVFESGDVLSLNATNRKTLVRAYGNESDLWIGKMIRMFLGMIEYQGSDHEAVLIEPISPPLKDGKADKADKANKANKATDQKKPAVDFDDEIPFVP